MTTYVLYSRDGAIDEFFNSNTSRVLISKLEDLGLVGSCCHGIAAHSLHLYSGGRTAGARNSEFIALLSCNSIDMGNITLAKAIHPEFVASCKYLGTMGDSRPVHIYEIDHLPGTAHVMARIPPDDMSRQRVTIKDFARFFAQSWNNDLQPCSDATTTLLMEFQSSFDLLARNLPSRFAPNLERVRKEPPSLFSKALPFVLSHGDLNLMNVLVNPETGNVTGIVDWAESKILPFGFALYGLENFLGWMDSEGWHYYDRYRELESLFWQTFREEAHNFSHTDLYLIRAGRMAGSFYRYGFNFDTKGAVQSVRMDQPHGSLAYLDAFCTAGEWDPLLACS